MDYLSDKLDELSLKSAYEQTDYQILDPEITIKCGKHNPALDAFLEEIGKRNWIFISGANPRSIIQSAKINAWNNTNLEIDIAKSACDYTYAIGKATSGKWPAEESFIVFNMSPDTAKILAQKYNQNAILVGRLRSKARLEWFTNHNQLATF